MSTYKLVVKGQVLPGYEAEAVKENIASFLKLMPDSKEMSAIFSGRAVSLQKKLNLEQAERYLALIETAGLECEIVSEHAATAVQPGTTQATAGETPAPQTPPRPPLVERVAGAQAAPRPEPAQDGDKTERAGEGYNPYQQPQAELDVPSEAGEFNLVEPKKLRAGAGWAWFKEGYRYFKMNPWAWIGAVILYFAILMGLSFIPIVSIVTNLLMPVLLAGFMLATYKQFQGEDFSIGDIFAGFKTNTRSLLAVGGLYFLGIILIGVVSAGLMFAFMGGLGNMAAMAQAGGSTQAPLAMLGFMLIVFALITPLIMAYWFAPALVILNDLTAMQAMRLSLKGCARNWPAFLVYGLAGFVLAIGAMLPLMLGLLVLAPVWMASVFAAYRQIYTDSEFA